jgi:hypothetical protein
MNWKSVGVGVIAFVAGLAGALAVVWKIEARTWEELQVYSNSMSLDAEMTATIHTHIINNIQAGNLDNAIRLSCLRLQGAVPIIRNDLFDDPERNQTARERVETARQLISDLESKNLCGLSSQDVH